MMRALWLLALAGQLAGSLPLIAQERGAITGAVVDHTTQAPLRGVQVVVVGTTLGGLTNQHGRFSIPNVPVGVQRVRASTIGYSQNEQEIVVQPGAAVQIAFELRQTAVELDGIVVNAVTGQAERRRELGTNTGTISAAEIDKAPITKLADVLTARTAGVTLQSASGTVGAAQRIRIRGANSLSLSNEPLVYVDGVQFSGAGGGLAVGGQNFSRLNDLNPEDIENIEILKGPAASALYGTAAANGVILITTRRGRTGNASWRFYTERGAVQDRNAYPSTYLSYQINDSTKPLFTSGGVLNAAGYTPCTNEAAARGSCRQDGVASLDPLRHSELSPFSTGHRQRVGVSVNGGSDGITYYMSADWEDDAGVIHFNTQERINLRANLTARLRDNATMQVTSGYTSSTLATISNDNSALGPLINGLLMAPYVPTDADIAASQPGSRPSYGFGYSLDDIGNNRTHQEVDRVTVGTMLSYSPFTWLTTNANTGLDFFNRFDHHTVQPGRIPLGAAWTPGRRTGIRAANYIHTGGLTGVATAKLHAALVSTSTLGTSYNRQQFRNTRCHGVGIVEGTASCSAASSLFEVEEQFTEVITIGAFARQQFALHDRVFLAGSIRGDDNSAFGEDFGLIYYPSASLSWVVSEEPFFPATGLLSNLRLRSSFGTSGLRPNFRDAVTLLESTAVRQGDQELSAVRLRSVGNTNLKPERTREHEIGGDVGMFENRVSLDVTYYQKLSRDALIRRQIAPSFGLTGDVNTTGVIFDNLGQIRNSGMELGLNTRLIEQPMLGLNVRLTASTLSNRIVEMGEGIEPIVFNRGQQRHQQGYPAAAFFQRSYTYHDADGDGKLTRDEVMLTSDTAVYIGASLPTNSQSLTADLRIMKNLTVSALLERRAGHKQLNSTEEFRCRTGFNRGDGNRGNCAGVADPNASLEEQARFVAARFHGTTAGFIEDADFIKWREVSVTAQASDRLATLYPALRGMSLTVSGRNLATWTRYSGMDPEINETGSQQFVLGGDFLQNEFNTQPPVRTLLVRVGYAF
jgi:TonB-dependent starch-binding outer membrane protein SusC